MGERGNEKERRTIGEKEEKEEGEGAIARVRERGVRRIACVCVHVYKHVGAYTINRERRGRPRREGGRGIKEGREERDGRTNRLVDSW